MPSYYDSTKAKPGLAEIKYKKGGETKKMAKGGKLKVTGMGAATRGGNFIRNG